MKYLILTTLLFCLNTMAFSQDSISIRTEIDTFSTPQYESDYDAFFLKKQPYNKLFKFGGSTIFRDYGVFANNISFVLETRLKQGVSLGIGVEMQDYWVRGEKVNPDRITPMLLYVEPRYYINKAQEIAAKRSADNLMGTYTGMRTGVRISPAFKGATYFSEAVLGLQQVFFQKSRHGLTENYVDVNLGLGAAYNTQQKWAMSYHFQMQLGGFFNNLTGKNTPKKDVSALCNIFRCYEEEKRLLKIDLFNLVNIANSSNSDLGLDVSYEAKINKSAFSANFGLNGVRYNLKTFAENDKKIKGYTFKSYIEPRWYYQMKKQIAKGNSANNLSGNYFALQMGYKNYEKNNYELNALTKNDKSDYAYAYLVYGHQQRMLKYFFLEYKFGVGAKSEKNLDGLIFNNGKNGGSNVGGFGEVKLGLAF
ncbi:MAG: hypothetical protein U5L45_17550 [Saprospiraceae bacterium]|nr:hypothetical protein [Saprospiraceae bacterium]